VTVRTAHGAARELGAIAVVETPPVDELPKGVPGPSPVQRPVEDRGKRFRAGDASTIEAARAGGRARRNRTALAHSLAVDSNDPAWRTYLRQAEAFRRAQVTVLASTVGGGQCGPAPAALVASAALALAASRFAYANGRALEGARLAAEVRQNLLGAHALAAQEAQARPRRLAWLEEPATTSSVAQDAFSDSEPAEGATPEDDALAGQPDGVNRGGES
jgi:hypothetical protein